MFWSTEEGKDIYPWSGDMPRHREDVLRFAVVGDNTGISRPGVFAQAMHQINWMQPEFVVSIGDLIEGFSHDPAHIHQEWDVIDAAVSSVQAPFFFIPGNHDLSTDEGLEVWRKRKGAPYYAFEYKEALFLCLSSEDPPVAPSPELEECMQQILHTKQTDQSLAEKLGAALHRKVLGEDPERTDMPTIAKARLSDQQVDFFTRVIKEHTAVRWTFVFMHKPGWGPDDGNFIRIENLLADRSYTMIAGHLHRYDYQRRLGRDYITVGTTGGLALNGSSREQVDHILWITLAEGQPQIANIRLNGLLDKTGQNGQLS
ncbi:metallophosphoesterase [Mycobacteroides immunogenum]|uniref:metallophosphoesterase family protein n=1 Tax=Mycobacteroides immunogenum TaxID=83262 RepID=UPI0025B75683|nr:metallophosphoesterase [Mycobacteroides immunogenum]WJR34208.1 metallophosphoesterase [Mycobacteroides immunogenum]